MRINLEQAFMQTNIVQATHRSLRIWQPLTLGLTLACFAASQSETPAHQTQISDGVGGTHHIEPNDTPRAGETSQTWFALTRAGGRAIGLSDCDCELVVADASGAAIAQPSLSAIAVEGLTDVPAAEVTFPTVGAYVLQLSGEPKAGAAFPAFQLDFPITVAAGQAVADPAPAPEASATPEPAEPAAAIAPNESAVAASQETNASRNNGTNASQPWIWALVGAGLGVAGVAAIWWRKQA